MIIRDSDSRPCEGTYVHTNVMVTMAVIRVHGYKGMHIRLDVNNVCRIIQIGCCHVAMDLRGIQGTTHIFVTGHLGGIPSTRDIVASGVQQLERNSRAKKSSRQCGEVRR